jgi:hypothetical protein
LRTELSSIYDRVPLLADHIKSEARKLFSWTESLDVSIRHVVKDPANQISSALSTGNPPGWRPVLADADSVSRLSQGGRSPISLLSADSPTQKSSACHTDGQRELIEDIADSSESPHSGAELEQAAHVADSAPKGRAASEAMLKSSSKMQQDTRNSPDSITTKDPQHEPHDSPDANPGKEVGEHMGPANYHEDILRGVTNNDLGPGLSAGDGKEVVQPHNHDVGEEDEGDEEDEELEEEQVEQMEQTEGDGEDDALYPAGANDGGAESFGIRVMKQNPEQDEEELQQHDLQKNRLSSSATSDGGINDTPGSPAPEGLDSTQGHMNQSGTPVVTISSSDVASTPEQETEYETEPGQITSNDRVEPHAKTSKVQREHSSITTQRKVDTAGAQSNQVRGFYDEDEIVVANALQGSEITNGSSAESPTNDTPAEDGQLQDPANTDDSNSGLEEDSDHVDTEDDVLIDEPESTPTNVKPRARKASGTHSSVLVTPRKRRKVSGDVIEQLTSSAVKDIPDSLIRPQELSELVVGMLDKSHKGATTALANLFFLIGSPYAVDCLRDACRQAHQLQGIDTIPEEAGARRSTCALDRIHAHDKVSPILRRYHLVQLVRRRNELQQKLNGITRQQEPVVLKYGLRKQPPAKALIGPKDAAGKALRELMKEAYPDNLTGKGEESAQYHQRLKELKNRLSAGYNWHVLQARFGIGILALLPVGKEVGIWNSE